MDSLSFLIKLPIRSLIILSRLNHHYNSFCLDLLSLKSDKDYLLEFTIITREYYQGILHPNLTIDYLSNHYDVIYNKNIKRYIMKINHHDFIIKNNTITMLYNDNFKNLFNTTYDPITNIHIKQIFNQFSFYNHAPISNHIIYKFIKNYFDRFNIMLKLEHGNFNETLIYNEINNTTSKFKIRGEFININIHINRHRITCYCKSSNYNSLLLDYQYLTIIMKEALYYNNMYYLSNSKNLKTFQHQMEKCQFDHFVKGYLGNYLIQLGKCKNDLYFDQLITKSNVKLDKYCGISYVKNKLLYRCWLLKEICNSIDYDNIMDICQLYRQIL